MWNLSIVFSIFDPTKHRIAAGVTSGPSGIDRLAVEKYSREYLKVDTVLTKYFWVIELELQASRWKIKN